jgi:hypothetical protein
MGEGESLWSPIICDHQMEQVDMAGYWITGSSWGVFQAQEHAGKQAGGVGKWP